MIRIVISALSGLIFGLGLMISDMVNPDRVQSFLDLTGAWDPTLMFVMGGAMIVSGSAWLIAYRRRRSFLGGNLPLTKNPDIDARLVGGSAIFGIGWGLVGICPGPSLVALGFGGWQVGVFVIAMLVGMALYNLVLLPKPQTA